MVNLLVESMADLSAALLATTRVETKAGNSVGR